jgi:hypothetical protein
MKSVAGIDCPCLDCNRRCGATKQANIYHRVFLAIASRDEVICLDYQESCFRGLEGVKA